jgi:alpha-1,2-mannosyltransferase
MGADSTVPDPGQGAGAPGGLARWVARLDARWSARTWIIVGGLTAAMAVQSWWVHARKRGDFRVFYEAAHRFAAGEQLYRASDGEYPFKYAPVAAVPFLPLGVLPEALATLVWVLLAAAALLAFMRWSAAALPAEEPLSTHLAVVVLLVPYSVHLLAMGQTDSVLLWLVAASAAVAPRRPLLSGLLWAAATLFKPTFLILVPLALLAREWRRIAAFGAGVAAGLLLPALRYGWQGNLGLLAAWRQILDATTPPLLCGPQNQSAFAVACTYLAEPAAGRSFQLASLAVGGVVAAPMLLSALAIARRDRSTGFRAALESALYLSAFLSPLGWRTNLVAAAPLLYRLVREARRGSDSALRGIAAVTLALLFLVQRLNWEVVGPDRFYWLLAHRHYGLSMAAAAVAALLLWARSASRPAS